MFSQINSFIKWVDDAVWGASIDHSYPGDRNLFISSFEGPSDQASGQGAEIHGEK